MRYSSSLGLSRFVDEPRCIGSQPLGQWTLRGPAPSPRFGNIGLIPDRIPLATIAREGWINRYAKFLSQSLDDHPDAHRVPRTSIHDGAFRTSALASSHQKGRSILHLEPITQFLPGPGEAALPLCYIYVPLR